MLTNMIKEITVYTVICDRCGKDSNSGEEHCGWSDKDIAFDIAVDYADFIEIDRKHYCSNCYFYDDDDNIIVRQ